MPDISGKTFEQVDLRKARCFGTSQMPPNWAHYLGKFLKQKCIYGHFVPLGQRASTCRDLVSLQLSAISSPAEDLCCASPAQHLSKAESLPILRAVYILIFSAFASAVSEHSFPLQVDTGYQTSFNHISIMQAFLKLTDNLLSWLKLHLLLKELIWHQRS